MIIKSKSGGVFSFSRLAGCFLSAILLPGISANAEIYVSENFRGTTASGWEFINGQGEGPSLTADTGVDPNGDGWLRLTNANANQNSFAYFNTAIPTNKGLVFTFDFVIWNTDNSVGDGFTLSIFDAAVTPSTGGFGGSLGYAQRLGVDGLAGAIAGFGFDEFGNYSNPTEGRIGGPGKTPNSVAIRGSMGETRRDGYEYVMGTGSLADFSSKNCDDRDDAVIHTVRITIPTTKIITVEWKTEDEDWTTLIGPHQCTLNCPDFIKFGYTSGTGSVDAYHEIRNLTVESVPEPATLCLLAAGSVFVMIRRKR